MTVRVLIADDQQLIRAGFRMILAAEPDIEVVGEAARTAPRPSRSPANYDPDVVLMDIRMPDSTASKRRDGSSPKPTNREPSVLILTTFDLDEYVYDALRAGASGFLLKDVPPTSSPPAYAWSATATRYSPPASPDG